MNKLPVVPLIPIEHVRRAQLILLAAEGVNHSKISQQLQLHRNQVRLWRQRWQLAEELLREAEVEGLQKS